MTHSVDLTVKGDVYQLRLTTRNTVKLEEALKKNPISMFLGIENNVMPTLNELMITLYYCLQAEHRKQFTSLDSVYDFRDDYIDDGIDDISLYPIILQVFQESGLIPKNTEEIGEEKN